MRRAAFIVMCVGFFAAGCEQERAEEAPICGGDGEGELSFWVRADGSGQVTAGEAMLFENGHSYMVVDKDCRYTVWSTTDEDGVWGGVVAGQINDRHRDLYKEIFGQIDWDSEDGVRYGEPGISHPANWTFSHAGRSFTASCVDCQGRASAVRRVGELMAALREDGAPLGADAAWVRAEALEGEAPGVTFEPAPSGMALASAPQGTTVLVEGGVAAALLAQRARVRGLTRGEYPHSFLALRDADGARYRVYVRPRTPLDDVRGRIVWE